MKHLFLFLILLNVGYLQAQTDSVQYKKRALDAAEISLLGSLYTQNGDNAAVTGGIGTESLIDATPTITVSMPIKQDGVLTADFGISAYSSASSGNLNPWDKSGASRTGNTPEGSPWVASSGASNSDVWFGGSLAYKHYSNDRNTIYSANLSGSGEYDYQSFGAGIGVAKLFNQKNTEISIKASLFLDKWLPQFPTELISYLEAGNDINKGFFGGVPILNSSGEIIDKSGTEVWAADSRFVGLPDDKRNTYAVSLGFSQILTKSTQFSLSTDLTFQQGWLSNPMQRVYFKDVPDYFIGDANDISNYANRDFAASVIPQVFQLADDIERAPNTRFKVPVGIRLNQYINYWFTLRTYYRYYWDTWGIKANTIEIETPIKIGNSGLTIAPSFRYYNQTKADFFYEFNEADSGLSFYTSDYDLSAFNANKFGLGITYTDIMGERNIYKFIFKSLSIKYSNYSRSNGLKANIVSAGIVFNWK